MATLILAGTATYAIIKWRIIVPTIVKSVDSTIFATPLSPKFFKQLLTPVSTLAFAGGISVYIIATADPLRPMTPLTELAYAQLVAALGGVFWPSELHWKISALQLTTVSSSLLARSESVNWIISSVFAFAIMVFLIGTYLKDLSNQTQNYSKKYERPEQIRQVPQSTMM